METVEICCRCKDCEHSNQAANGYSFFYCDKWADEYGIDPIVVEADDFCSYGEVKNA